MLKELLEYLAKNLVENPDAVSVEAIEDGETTTLRLKVAQSDVGRVIGREGRNARAMRTLLHAVGAKSGRRTKFEIVE
ncbi:MAG: KH domain-containing protein [candidate division NC10 bacterium]|nr:KH domain-containing protein [candidate division NC10 bacterium]